MSDGKTGRYNIGGGDDGLEDDDANETAETTTTQSKNQSEEIPHRVRFDSPTKGRTELPFVLEDDDQQRLSELKSLADREFDERVYKMDVYLAALRSDFENDNSFLEEMRNIGYAYFE